MTDKVNVNAEMLRRQEYVRRIIRAVNYKGDNDYEDVPSILYEYQEENLDLINRQKAEIEGLKAENEKLEYYLDCESTSSADVGRMLVGEEKARAEAINKFAERVTELSISKGVYPVITKNILETVKAEMGVSDSGNKSD